MKSLVENENFMIPLANKEDKKIWVTFVFVISKLAGVEFFNFQSVLLMSDAICRRNLMETWSTCNCVILPFKSQDRWNVLNVLEKMIAKVMLVEFHETFNE